MKTNESSEWRTWLAFWAGRIVSTPHGMTSGRDALRELRARFDHMGAPVEEWAGIERAALDGKHAISLSSERVARNVVAHLAGGQMPIGPLDRISG